MRTFLPLGAALAAFLTAPAPAQDWFPDKTIEGVAAGENHGYSIARLDVYNGTSDPLMAVGAFASNTNGTNSGAVFVYDGTDGSELFSASGQTAGDLLGFDVIGLGEQAKGTNVFAVSAPFFTGAGAFSGRVYLLDTNTEAIVAILDGSSAGELFGYALTASDVDNDGFAELVVGSPGFDNQRGKATVYDWDGNDFVFLGDASGASEGDYFGFNLANGGDMFGNSAEEVLVAAPFADGVNPNDESGRIEVLAPNIQPVSDPYFTANAPGAHIGIGLDGNGKLTGDGIPDVVAGAPDANGGDGAVFTWSGANANLIDFIAGGAGEQFGYAVAFIGDIGGGNYDEIAVGAPGYNSDEGKVEILELPQPLVGIDLQITHTIDGYAGSRYGWSVARVGDLDTIAGDDLAVGAPENNGTLGNGQGLVETWLTIPTIEISFQGYITAGEPVDVLAENLIPGSTVNFLVDTDDDPSNGTLADIEVSAGVGLGTATGTIAGALTDNFTPGDTLYVQVREDDVIMRFSNVIGEEVFTPIVITLDPDTIVEGDGFDYLCTGLLPGADAEFWIDTDNDPIGGLVLVDTVTANGSGEAMVSLPGAFTTNAGAGTDLFFQVQELTGDALIGGAPPFPDRVSNLLERTVQGTGGDLIPLQLICPGGGGLQITVNDAHPNAPVYIFGALQADPTPMTPAPGDLAPANFLINLKGGNLQEVTSVNADGAGDMVFQIGQNNPKLAQLSGFTIYVQCVSVDGMNPATWLLSEVGSCTLP